MKNSILLFLFACFVTTMHAQNPQATSFRFTRLGTFTPRDAQSDFNARIHSLEAPLPGGSSYRSFLASQKMKLREQFMAGTLKNAAAGGLKSAALPPVVQRSFGMQRTLSSGTVIDITGGIPNDNSMAISNAGILLAAINSVIYAYDMDGDSALFTNTISLRTIGGGGGINDYYFDPKVIYDEVADRFILVFLKNADPATNGYIVAFSSTANPADPWNTYFITGNPLNNNRWTDFPAISLVNNTLFITGNLIIDTAPTWQEGFDGSIIWEIPTEAGYAGADEIEPVLYSDIRFNGRFIRNLHPVQGSRGQADQAFFMSNRNFDIQNDTVFILHLHPSAEGDTLLDIKIDQANVPYGMPPNGRQADTDLADPTSGLQTNDARVLGALLHEGEIRYVANTLNTATGFSAIYFGRVQDPANQPLVSGQILGDSLLDFGYPNLAFSGNENCDSEWLIGFNYTSPDSFPGVACFYIDGDGNTSDLTVLKAGENSVDRLSGGYERWGDYFGMQLRFNQPGKVYTTGFYALFSRKNGTWISELQSPDTTQLHISVAETGNASACEGTFTVSALGARPPIDFMWNGQTGSEVFSGACAGDTIELKVSDSKGCSKSLSLVATPGSANSGVFPNPVISQVFLKFTLPAEALVKAEIIDLSGRLVAELVQAKAKSGLNELQFNLDPLAQGIYFIRLSADGKELLNEKIVRAND